ncbi:NUDIX domain-containing protein [Streptomonospora nanhaiensis]|uniref:NUDIX domain-containing protein n=1 Tax=Streptomonospora nanhaiensis TaxID=1323731 RepID=A0ABY6YJM4_9ACTN|nr:NUDIX domain-containing protein [Streptomonospora nanhaiensis]WAE72484.1 NUDIX domain-containing protein [Streptomonospora nanhaiensis]
MTRNGRDRVDNPEANGQVRASVCGEADHAVLSAHEALAVVLQIRSGELCVLLWRRALPPCEGEWALPGGRLGAGESLGASIRRQLAQKVDVRDLSHLEQLETRSDPGRHPQRRTLATAYLGLVPANIDPVVPADTGWHPAALLPPMAFDHASIVRSGHHRLRAKLSYTNVGFALAPPEFTMSELSGYYRAALGHDVAATNLRRVLLRRGQIEETGRSVPSGRSGGRPAALFRFRTRGLEITDAFAVLRPPG